MSYGKGISSHRNCDRFFFHYDSFSLMAFNFNEANLGEGFFGECGIKWRVADGNFSTHIFQLITLKFSLNWNSTKK
jgi:hypothetical protein